MAGLVILAADHRARGVITIEPYQSYLAALRAALPHCDGILASTQPLADLVAAGTIESDQRTPVDQSHRSGRLRLRARRPTGGAGRGGCRRRLYRDQAHDQDRHGRPSDG
ncbi:MAG TPA: hypothetical protein VLL25_08145, partial [Acidimicrobiales bacterium]|nr:hypothetical protein [Acidimicrobiales bacterium]